MKISTNWVSPPQAIGGLDHLGTQAPCILIYSQLLPGITNVTDRARYYSLYPWLIWSFDQRHPSATSEDFVEYYRRADCLLTLIAERHARVTDNNNERHGTAMVGRNQLLPALDRLDANGLLRLSEYTASDSPTRYFKNSLGGLRQYYAGTLSDLQLIDASAKPWIKYTVERGEPLAKAVESTVESERFWKVVGGDLVTVADLDALTEFCPCRLPHSAGECDQLTDLYFDRNSLYGPEGMQRQRSLGLLLHLAESLAALDDDIELNEWVFRASAYTGTLPGGHRWRVPDALRATRSCWVIYQRNDMLSVACQSVFASALHALQPQEWSKRQVYGSVEEFAAAFSQSGELGPALSGLGGKTFGDLVDLFRTSAPALEDWEDDDHEVTLAHNVVPNWVQGEDVPAMIVAALKLLALLALRDDPDQPAYGTLAISSDALQDYPINLVSFRSRVTKWRDMNLANVITDLVSWCLNTHLKVALRKLRQTNRSTFHMRPSERGLEVVGEIPPPAHTTPRFRQAVQILRDIGAFSRLDEVPNGPTVLTQAGRSLLETTRV